MYSDKSILITAYNRPRELVRSIEALKECDGFNEYNLVIVYHGEVEEVSNCVTELKMSKLILLPVRGHGRTGLQNININRIIGLKYCFDMLQSSLVLTIEDDICVGYDALRFGEEMLAKYGDDADFRCVNLGSLEKFSPENMFCYGKFRYGLFGQGAFIGAKQYQQETARGLHKWDLGMGIDSVLEQYYKTGFVIMPYVSRYIDNGWNGTHAPKDSNHAYYQDLRASFIGSSPFEIAEYVYREKPFRWRRDCVRYHCRDNFISWLRYARFRLVLVIKRFLGN